MNATAPAHQPEAPTPGTPNFYLCLAETHAVDLLDAIRRGDALRAVESLQWAGIALASHLRRERGESR